MKGIILFNENLNIIRWNKVSEMILGYKEEEVVNHIVTDFFNIDLSNITEIPHEVEIESKRKDKSDIFLSVISSSVYVAENRFYLLIFRDVSHRKNNELQIKILNEALRLRVQTLEQFNYMVAHDLNAPLRSLEGFSEILIQDYAKCLDGAGIDCINRIIVAAKRMRDLISDMIRLSRITTYDISVVKYEIDLTELFKEVNKHCEMDNGSRVATVNIEEGMKIVGDYTLIKVMVENLLSNAWKFTSKKDKTVIDIGTKHINNETVYFIKDNGAGFDQTKSDKLFKPFERLHSLQDFHGNGIGLTIVKRVIDLHNGKIWGEGVIGLGATFYFTIGDST